ncbi:hypothetical protein Gohar_019791 [Gossypium harknessii]|uniref:Secreted protein n=8 Tax=Gossypium TaxID=3633 RepID=A0A7J9IAH0_9ROSI|nr:hypothetical protein [Gossypium harknessii]
MFLVLGMLLLVPAQNEAGGRGPNNDSVFERKEKKKKEQMEGNNSYGNGSSWADQWDYSDPAASNGAANKKKSSSGGATAKYKQKVGDGLEKTKAVASTGMKKVKQGTSSGLQWIKDKYHKTTQKH